MRVKASFIRCIFLVAICIFSVFCNISAAEERYDLVYIWDQDLDRVLDYKEQLEQLFDDDVKVRLKIVGRNDEYGVIYDTNGSARNVSQEFAQHGEILRKAGLKEAWAIKDEGYHRLYNVSYGLGPNLDSLKKTYDKLYSYLGKEVGKNLFIEKTNAANYTLIFRRRGDRVSTMEIATAHAKLLKGKKIRTSITPENNNEVVYGESSLLDDSGNDDVADTADTADTVDTVDTADAADAADAVGAEDTVSSTDDDNNDEPSTDQSLAAKDSEVVAEPQPSSPQAVKPASPVTVSVLKKTVYKNVVGKKEVQGRQSLKLTDSRGAFITASSDTVFEKNIETFIKSLRRKGAIRGDEKTGWMVYDLENDKSLVDINANTSFQAASMIKPFVALAYFHEIERGKLKYSSKGRQMVESMIQRSNNSATNWVMRQVGGPARCEQILNSNYGSIFKRTAIREYIPAGGRTYKNSAQPSDYIRFLRALWNNDLPYGKEMRRIMALPGRDRLYHGTAIPQGTLVYNKTGSTAHLIGDMGILVPKTQQGNGHPYAIVGIIERSSRANDYGNWMLARSNVIRQVSTLVYEEMKKKYHLR